MEWKVLKYMQNVKHIVTTVVNIIKAYSNPTTAFLLNKDMTHANQKPKHWARGRIYEGSEMKKA